MNLVKIIVIIILLVILCACKDVYSAKTSLNPNIISIHKEIENNDKVFYGTVKAQVFPTLSFQSEGQIIYFPYTRGDFIKKGQIIAKLDGALYKIQKDEEAAALKEAEIQYAKAKKYYERMNTLHKAGGISDNDWEDAYFSFKTSAKKVDIQKQKINYINKQINYNALVAPFDGYIDDKFVNTGTFVNAGSPVITFIKSNSKPQVEIVVEPSFINNVKLNQKADVIRNEKIYKGKIEHIAKSSSTLGGYLVKIILDNFEKELLDGMSVTVKLEKENKSAIFVPVSSIFEQNGESYVYKLINFNNKHKIQKQKILIKNINGDKAEIEGLEENDKIISSNVEQYKEGELLNYEK